MIRRIEEKDIDACRILYNWYITHTSVSFETEELDLQSFSDRVHSVCEKYPWIVLEEAGTICGYAYLSAYSDRHAYSWTADVSVYIEREQRGKGYGRALLNTLCEIAQKTGYKQLVSVIAEGNEASEGLHCSLGFEKKAVFERFGYKNGKWTGVSFWVKRLTDVFEEDPSLPKTAML